MQYLITRNETGKKQYYMSGGHWTGNKNGAIPYSYRECSTFTGIFLPTMPSVMTEEVEENETPIKNWDKLEEFTPADVEPSSDTRYFRREFSGRMTPARMIILERYAKTYTWTGHSHCSHEYDCCGCQCGQEMEITYAYNQVRVLLTLHYNY